MSPDEPLLHGRGKEAMTSVTVFDGAETIGGNKIFVEEGGAGVFLDFGMNFGKMGRYYEEFLKPRAARGIHDLVKLGLAPAYDLYRDDLVPSDVRVTGFPQGDVRAVLISHAHMDHCGYMGLLRDDIPFIGSATSIALLKAMQDTQNLSLGSDIAYYARKERYDDEGIVLRAGRKAETCGRSFLCTSPVPETLRDFLCARARKTKEIQPGTVDYLCCDGLPFEITAHHVDHSIFGATAYILAGEKTIAYTGDFRLHGTHGDRTMAFAKEAKGVDVLITEGTRAGRESDGEDTGSPNVSEEEVYGTCLATVEDATSLVVADFSPRNLERLGIFQKIASRTGRSLVVTAKDAYLLHALGQVEGSDLLDRVLVYDALRASPPEYWEARAVSGTCEYVGHREIRRHPGQYILCFSIFDMNHLLDISPEGGDYIYSSCEAFSEEMAIDFRRLLEWLRFFGMNVHGFSLEEGALWPSFERGFHASGHASREDLERFIDTIDPGVIIPVHTTGHEWFRETFDNVRTVRDGDRIDI
ncbi:MAG: MBL fold metallo-hydrolase RNA specificity domain-containing protein [Methanoculleaceae archaeon]